MLKHSKVLVICAHAETALDLDDALRVRSGIPATVFHEGMSIVERDRAAAFFADEEFGAQVMICSEIGSEGRNFQFAQDRKSTRLNSSHVRISYAVFCLKKKKK